VTSPSEMVRQAMIIFPFLASSGRGLAPHENGLDLILDTQTEARTAGVRDVGGCASASLAPAESGGSRALPEPGTTCSCCPRRDCRRHELQICRSEGNAGTDEAEPKCGEREGGRGDTDGGTPKRSRASCLTAGRFSTAAQVTIHAL